MGAATARLFASEGAKVALGDVKEDAGAALAKELGDAAMFQKLDVSSDDSWRAFVEAAAGKFGGIDVLINNAGLVHFTPIEAFNPADATAILGVNVVGPMLGAKHAVPHMKKRGKGVIVNISSVDGLRGCNGLTLYTASKWAVRGLTKSLAYELGPQGIRVCSVHPGAVDTPMGNHRGQKGDELNANYKRVPLQRIGQPEEIARASLFVASDDASYITGAEIAVDGGWSAGYYQPALPGAPSSIQD
jgi:3alpha(or 20beta)-hydroxysteroid dehydrogenase